MPTFDDFYDQDGTSTTPESSSDGTGTYTVTSTITRTEALVSQLNLLVVATTGSTKFLGIIRRCIREKWVSEIYVRGLTPQGLIQQEITVRIDWEQHTAELSRPNEGEIPINPRLPGVDQISSVIGQLIDGFNEMKSSLGLTPKWFIQYREELKPRKAELNRLLGLVSDENRKWISSDVETLVGSFAPKKQPELTYEWKAVTGN